MSRKLKFTAITATLLALTLCGCEHRTLAACQASTGTECHEGLDGYYYRGRGIDVNSPAGQVLLNGMMGVMAAQASNPQPYLPALIPLPTSTARPGGFTCHAMGSTLVCN